MFQIHFSHTELMFFHTLEVPHRNVKSVDLLALQKGNHDSISQQRLDTEVDWESSIFTMFMLYFHGVACIHVNDFTEQVHEINTIFLLM